MHVTHFSYRWTVVTGNLIARKYYRSVHILPSVYFFLGKIIAARKFHRSRKITSAKAPSQVLLYLP